MFTLAKAQSESGKNSFFWGRHISATNIRTLQTLQLERKFKIMRKDVLDVSWMIIFQKIVICIIIVIFGEENVIIHQFVKIKLKRETTTGYQIKGKKILLVTAKPYVLSQNCKYLYSVQIQNNTDRKKLCISTFYSLYFR